VLAVLVVFAAAVHPYTRLEAEVLVAHARGGRVLNPEGHARLVTDAESVYFKFDNHC